MPLKIDLTGQRFGRLIVLKDSGKRIAHGHIIWLCKCSCGKQVKVISGNLRNGYTRSCGCLKREQTKAMGKACIKHGENSKNSRLYTAWINLKRKCYNPNALIYDKYGGRGVRICKEWLGKQGYINFRTWALNNGYPPSLRDFVIDRINIGGNYDPNNCKWMTRSESTRKRLERTCVP